MPAILTLGEDEAREPQVQVQGLTQPLSLIKNKNKLDIQLSMIPRVTKTKQKFSSLSLSILNNNEVILSSTSLFLFS